MVNFKFVIPNAVDYLCFPVSYERALTLLSPSAYLISEGYSLSAVNKQTDEDPTKLSPLPSFHYILKGLLPHVDHPDRPAPPSTTHNVCVRGGGGGALQPGP